MDSSVFLSVRQISKVYENKRRAIHSVLDGVSFDVSKGEIISLLGVNGGGKTTLASILSTLCPPSNGSILFEGRSIYDDLAAYRYKIGFCQHLPNFNNALAIDQNLIFTGRFFGLSDSQSSMRMHELATQLNFEKYLHDMPRSLSGGYLKRAMIARALMHKPQLLIIDELSTGLDMHIKQCLWRSLKALRQAGTTVIVTTHSIEEAEDISDRICILHKGKVLTIDMLENLKSFYKSSSLQNVFMQLTEEDSE